VLPSDTASHPAKEQERPYSKYLYQLILALQVFAEHVVQCFCPFQPPPPTTDLPQSQFVACPNLSQIIVFHDCQKTLYAHNFFIVPLLHAIRKSGNLVECAWNVPVKNKSWATKPGMHFMNNNQLFREGDTLRILPCSSVSKNTIRTKYVITLTNCLLRILNKQSDKLSGFIEPVRGR
jgi:hypothetical protein